MNKKIIFYAFTFLCASLFFRCDFKKETKYVKPVITESTPTDSVIVKKEAQLENNDKPLQDIFAKIDFNKFSDIITENDRRELKIFLPITRIEKYTSLGEEYLAVFTEDMAIPESPDFPNSRINFYLLKKLNSEENTNNNYEVINKFSRNYEVYNKYDVKYNFLNNVCDFGTVDDNGNITPIIFTQGRIIKYKTESTTIHIFSKEKIIPIEIYNATEGTLSVHVSPYFYTLSNTIQNKVKQIINDIDGIRVEPYSEEFEDYIGFERFWDTKKCFWDGSTEPVVYQSTQVANTSLELPSAPLNSLEELKDIYESTFPTSQPISFNFGINLHHELELHTGAIYNNMDTSVILPDAKLEYFFVSEKNKVLTQTIFEHNFLLLEPKSSDPFDDNSIRYDLNDGYHAINWDYQNGWESENLRLFPKELQEGKYVVYAKLSYFDGEQEQVFFSKKEILNYLKPNNRTKNKELLTLKVKYDSIYPASKDLQIDTGIKYYNKEGTLQQFQYMPYIKNITNYPIDTNESSFIFYYVNDKDEVFKKEISNAFFNVLEPNDSDILGDSYFTNIVDEFWVDNNMIFDSPIGKNLEKGEYIIFSELISNEGQSYYSKKEFIDLKDTALHKSQKTDSLYQSYETFTKELSKNKSVKGKKENSSNCFNRKSDDKLYSITTCYYPKQFKIFQLYNILKYSNISLTDKLIEQVPKRDTIYLTKHNDKVLFNIPKRTTDTLKIKINKTQYHIYKKDNFPVIEKYFRLN
ncbi:hypothetical protein I2486_16345 [Cellulophaga sp. E16_2]|uniref:DUF4430 domain-containing protein n=1 Tax=unclassified Cellulophaga TaxID=2634405 RepID=UPI0013FE09A3|nr:MULTISPECIES: DUF4430 domain-containing protein [unclassified Cellulophaga]MBO0592974.1 hypothetical protein [Cellulophaga sp. E16_2]